MSAGSAAPTGAIDRRLPVPGPWQAPVHTAIDALRARIDVPVDAVAVARVNEVEGIAGLDIWLVAAGRTWIFRVIGGEAVAFPPD